MAASDAQMPSVVAYPSFKIILFEVSIYIALPNAERKPLPIDIKYLSVDWAVALEQDNHIEKLNAVGLFKLASVVILYPAVPRAPSVPDKAVICFVFR